MMISDDIAIVEHGSYPNYQIVNTPPHCDECAGTTGTTCAKQTLRATIGSAVRIL